MLFNRLFDELLRDDSITHTQVIWNRRIATNLKVDRADGTVAVSRQPNEGYEECQAEDTGNPNDSSWR